MITASNEWIKAHDEGILPEMFVELSYGIVDAVAQESAIPAGKNEAVFSNTENVTGGTAPTQYATLEKNLWVLNGTRSVFSTVSPNSNTGYASQNNTSASIELVFPQLMTTLLPGITITWSSEYDEYPLRFQVTAKNGNTVIAEKLVNENSSNTSTVDLDLVDYDKIIIDVYAWNLPDHRVRIDNIVLGQGLTFTKKDLVDFTHEQTGDLTSGSLPKNSIRFSLDNSTGRWNPDNPQGTEKYLAERQPVTVRYGMDVGDGVEWINGGTFYLSEWNTPANGMTATFTARDVFEYLLDAPYTGNDTDTFRNLIYGAMDSTEAPDSISVLLDSEMDSYTATVGEKTAAEVIQLCANATGCVIYQNRDGDLSVRKLSTDNSNFIIRRRLALSHPEISLSKPLKNVDVFYGNDSSFRLSVATSGETQTLTNPFIATAAQAEMVAKVVKNALVTRKSVSGEFRADPRLDVYDIVTVESKYGEIYPVVLTDIAYRYSGSFWATYKGRVLDFGENGTVAILGTGKLDEMIL